MLRAGIKTLSRVSPKNFKSTTQFLNRGFSVSTPVFQNKIRASSICHTGVEKSPEMPSASDLLVQVTYIDHEGNRRTVPGRIGQNLLEVAHEHGIQLLADPSCMGHAACAVCHVIISTEYYDLIPQSTEDEADCLKVAAGLTENSRLGCQIVLEKCLDGIVVAIPSQPTTNDTQSFWRM